MNNKEYLAWIISEEVKEENRAVASSQMANTGEQKLHIIIERHENAPWKTISFSGGWFLYAEYI